MVLTGARIAKDAPGPDSADIRFAGNGTLRLVLESMMQERDIRLDIAPSTRTRVTGTASIAGAESLTPEPGDTIKIHNVTRTYDGTEWK